MFDKLVTKVNAIDTSKFVLKIQYNTDKSSPEKKIHDADKRIPDTSGLVLLKVSANKSNLFY